MKLRKVALLLVVFGIITYMLAGCGCEHEYSSIITKEATCVENGIMTYTCDLCGHSRTEPIPKSEEHDYASEITKEATIDETGIETYTCTLCGDSYTEIIDKLPSNWEIGFYVDDFGDKTNDSYIIGTFEGEFSNSATTGSELTVYVYFDKSYKSVTTIRLLEYGSHKATFLSSETITLKTKNSLGKTNSYTLTYSGGDLYSFDINLRKEIESSKQLSMAITTSSKYQSVADTYKFKVDNIGLDKLLK